jgi:hypothetical protein
VTQAEDSACMYRAAAPESAAAETWPPARTAPEVEPRIRAEACPQTAATVATGAATCPQVEGGGPAVSGVMRGDGGSDARGMDDDNDKWS